MLSFKEFYLLEITNPHHRRRSLTRGNKFSRNGSGNLEKANQIANRYKKGDPNHKDPLPLGPILPNDKRLLKYNINLSDIPNNGHKQLSNSKQAVKRVGNILTIINL